jgi:hypothetical protein
LIGLGLLCSRPFIQAAIVGAVGLAALRSLARDNRTKNQARLGAWFSRQNQRLEHHDKAT